jgi:hypothetical protein
MTIVGKEVVLKSTLGGADVQVGVFSYFVGRPSPCIVITDGVQRLIGGSIESLEEMLQTELADYPDYVVKSHSSIFVN